jgi:hypothetical protein
MNTTGINNNTSDWTEDDGSYVSVSIMWNETIQSQYSDADSSADVYEF